MNKVINEPQVFDEHGDLFAMIAKGINRGSYEDGSVPNIGREYSSLDQSEIVQISNLADQYGFKSVIFNFNRILAEDILIGKVHSVVEG
ncbi:hypothetical protein [Microbulbifer epialgicus]|uniref:Uncharacterized protein n=1 Tax=Microbulbifer epialgicus TaxID=393907 RepID=A0ABV4NTX5_9GAMM